MDVELYTCYSLPLRNYLQKKCEKPTPLGVGWIAQKYKNNVYVDIENIHIL